MAEARSPLPYTYTSVGHNVVIESETITILEFADGRVTSDGFAMFTLPTLDDYSTLLETTIEKFDDLVNRANPGLVRVPVVGVPQFEYRTEIDGRWHIEVLITSDDNLIMDAWYDRDTGIVTVDQVTSFDIEWPQSRMWSEALRRFVSMGRVWDGSISLPPAGLP